MAITRKHSFGYAPDGTSFFNQRLADGFFQYHSPFLHKPTRNKYRIVTCAEGERVEEVKEMVVHSFTLSDVDDPDIYAAEPLYEWEHSEFGQWVMKNACDTPTWHRMADPVSYGYKYQIRAKFSGPALTEMALRYAFK